MTQPIYLCEHRKPPAEWEAVFATLDERIAHDWEVVPVPGAWEHRMRTIEVGEDTLTISEREEIHEVLQRWMKRN